MNDKRMSWEKYFLDIVGIVAQRGTCDRGKSGAIIVKDRQIIATGYVGAPAGMFHCDEVGHLLYHKTEEDRTSEHCGRTVHAEMNAIAQAAKRGASTKGATMYCSMSPCWDCAKLIDACGIVFVVCKNDYHASQRTKEMFFEKGIVLKIMDESLAY